MKAKIRIPTSQYAFIEVDIEDEPKAIIQAHNDLLSMYEEMRGQEWETKEFKKILDKYWINGIHPDEYESLTIRQKEVLDFVKRMKKRVKGVDK